MIYVVLKLVDFIDIPEFVTLCYEKLHRLPLLTIKN